MIMPQGLKALYIGNFLYVFCCQALATSSQRIHASFRLTINESEKESFLAIWDLLIGKGFFI